MGKLVVQLRALRFTTWEDLFVFSDHSITSFGPVYAAITSASLSLLATGIDSVFDIGSNITLYWLHKKARSLDVNKWPVGGSRLETIGNIVYGSYTGFFSRLHVH